MTDDKPAKGKSADFRGRLAQELLDAQEDALEVLREAMKATTEGKDWFTIECKHCNRQGRYELKYKIPAHKERLAALQMWSDQGFGKAAQAAKPDQETPDHTIDAASMTAEQRAQLIPILLKHLNNPDLTTDLQPFASALPRD